MLDLGKLGNAYVNTVIPRPILDQVRTSLQQVTQGLQFVKSGFDGLKNMANNFAQLTNFPGMDQLAQRLLGPDAGSLLGQGFGGLERFLNDQCNSLMPRQFENGQTVTPPGMGHRNLPSELLQIFNQLGLGGPQGSQQQFNTQMGNAIDTLDRNFALLDGAASKDSSKRTDGLIGKKDLEAVLNNPNAPQDLKDACKFLLENPAARNQFDVASRIGNVDGLIGRSDLQAMKSQYPPVGSFNPMQGFDPTRGLPPGQQAPGSQYTSALQNLKQNFSLLDTAAGEGSKDGVIGYNDLKAALKNPGLPQDLKDSISFLLSNPGMLRDLDSVGGDHKVNRRFSLADIDSELSTHGANPSATPYNQFGSGTRGLPFGGNFQTQLQSPFGNASFGAGFSPQGFGFNTQLTTPFTNTQAQFGTMPPSYGASTSYMTAPSQYGSMLPSYGAPTSYMAAPSQYGSMPPVSAGGDGSISSILASGLGSESGMLTQQENQMLSQIKDPNQRAMMKAQMELQHAQEVLSFISNVMKKMNEMAMAVIGNLK